jgi:hypothetical protein
MEIGNRGRFSAKRNAEAVVRLLNGESCVPGIAWGEKRRECPDPLFLFGRPYLSWLDGHDANLSDRFTCEVGNPRGASRCLSLLPRGLNQPLPGQPLQLGEGARLHAALLKLPTWPANLMGWYVRPSAWLAARHGRTMSLVTGPIRLMGQLPSRVRWRFKHRSWPTCSHRGRLEHHRRSPCQRRQRSQAVRQLTPQRRELLSDRRELVSRHRRLLSRRRRRTWQHRELITPLGQRARQHRWLIRLHRRLIYHLRRFIAERSRCCKKQHLPRSKSRLSIKGLQHRCCKMQQHCCEMQHPGSEPHTLICPFRVGTPAALSVCRDGTGQ